MFQKSLTIFAVLLLSALCVAEGWSSLRDLANQDSALPSPVLEIEADADGEFGEGKWHDGFLCWTAAISARPTFILALLDGQDSSHAAGESRWRIHSRGPPALLL